MAKRGASKKPKVKKTTPRKKTAASARASSSKAPAPRKIPRKRAFKKKPGARKASTTEGVSGGGWADGAVGAEVFGRRRVVIDRVRPCVDAGRFPVKRAVGEAVDVEVDLVCDGHDALAGEVVWRSEASGSWSACPLCPDVNDLWHGAFVVTEPGWHEYTVRAWVDRFGSWARDMRKRLEARQDVRVDLAIGRALVEEAAEAAGEQREGLASRELAELAEAMRDTEEPSEAAERAISQRVVSLMREHAPRHYSSELDHPIRIWVDRPRALFSAWYEMFPRSASDEPGKHGDLNDVRERLQYVAGMGFDVLYLPPIHPIGTTFRKGPNNATEAGDQDPGSCWAIGSKDGGHTSIHPALGSFEDFDRLVSDAAKHGIEIALDIAFQCSPDHPWVKKHPSWFKHRPDGTIQYAENPPKKYQDIYPLDFETDDWENLWRELKTVFEFWADRGVRIFRVDNPHTKSFNFWEWCLAELRESHPDLIFLSEAFTRPKRMNRLAKAGFTQSYTYFAWRNGPADLEQYMHELTRTDTADFFRPNFWPNTPDILTEYLQHGGRPAAIARLILAATLSSNYGIYGPAFELMDYTPREPGSEETLNSEKYQLRHWQLDHPWSLAPLISLVNRIRQQNRALQQTRSINFHHVDNPALVAYSKRDRATNNTVLCIVNTNPFEDQRGHVHLDFAAIGVDPGRTFAVSDQLTGHRYEWWGGPNFVALGPGGSMAHIFLVEQDDPAKTGDGAIETDGRGLG